MIKADILLIDSGSNNLRLLECIMSKQEYGIRNAASWEAVLEAVNSQLPDLIIQDVVMNDISAYEVCERLKADARTFDIPVVFISDEGDMAEKVMAFSAGGVDFITRPFQEDEVLARVAIHLKLRKLRKSLVEKNIRLEREIAERKQVQDELAASQKELYSIIRTVPDVIYRLDTRGRIIFISDSVRRYGYNPKMLIGTHIIDMVYDEDKEKAADKINERRTGKRKTRSFEVRLITRKKTAVPFEIFSISAEGLYATEDAEGACFVGTQGIARDISDRKRAEEALLNREKFQAVLETAGAVCHELNQPMQGILGYSELLMMDMSEDSPLYDRILKIKEQIERLKAITAKLMGITRYETKAYGGEKKIIDLDNVKERRKFKRFIPCGHAFVIPKSDVTKQRQVIDLSLGGVALWCNELRDKPAEFSDIAINLSDHGFMLDNIPCRVTSGFTGRQGFREEADKMTRCGIKFGNLTEKQQKSLEYMIREYTSAHAE